MTEVRTSTDIMAEENADKRDEIVGMLKRRTGWRSRP